LTGQASGCNRPGTSADHPWLHSSPRPRGRQLRLALRTILGRAPARWTTSSPGWPA